MTKVNLPASVVTMAGVPDSIIEGIAIRGYGNSYLGITPPIASANYFNRVSQWMRSTAITNLGISSTLACDICNFAHGTFSATTATGNKAGTWVPTALPSGVIIIEPGRNDAGWDAFESTAKARLGFSNSLDSLIRLLRAGSAIQDTVSGSFGFSGTWSSAVNAKMSGGNTHNTATPGSIASVTATPVNGELDLIIGGFDTTVNGAPFTCTLDGADYTATLSAAGYPTTSNSQLAESKNALSTPWTQLALPFTGLTNATHTITITHAGTSSQSLYVNRLLIPSLTPPTIIINKVAPLSVYTNYGAGASSATDAIYNSLIDTVVARFPSDGSVAKFDPSAAGWNPATMISSVDASHVHLNDLGQVCYATGLKALLNSLASRQGLNVI